MSETEIRNKKYVNIEEWDNKSILSGLMESQQKAFDSVQNSLGEIEIAVSLAVKKIQKYKSSQIVYVGSGTSGRIGMLDGVELIPTFGWPNNRLKFCFSGKDVSKPSEGSEDDIELAKNDFQKSNITSNDVVICVAASGTTKYTVAILEMAKKIGAMTIAIFNNNKSTLLNKADVKIYLSSGSEFLAGSTRLAAGTSQKITLNLFSTCLMIRLHKVYKGFMVDMKVSNAKLRKRAENMLSEITSCDISRAHEVLLETNYNIKLSILMLNNYSKGEAIKLLNDNDGNLNSIL
ncbi:N-acetylmuramic acid 6-phosphate etherase [Alphaproteobacteria bacterium]|nr:N-acetylmuramic acid 6-phosphate etherase [Alphaproteobacteria bacterium]